MILIATQCFAPAIGGIESLMTGLAAALHRRGHHVLVCADRQTGQDSGERFPWPMRRFGGPRPWRRRAKARYINRAVRRGDITHIICDSWKSLEYLSVPESLPVLCLAHGMEFPQAPSAGKRQRIRASLARAGCVVANSRYTAGKTRPFLAADARLEIIHPGIDAPAKPGEIDARKAQQQLAGFTPRLISVARLEEHKGQDRVLQNLPGLLRDFPGLGYLCLGEGPARPALEKLARDLGVAEHVVFAGNADESVRNACLAASDVFVLPGRRVNDRIEGFGMAFIEAAWLGLPAIAGREGGGGEAVVDGLTGLVCDGADTAAVGRAIRTLLTDEALRTRLGQQARERAVGFSWDSTVLRYEALLGLA